MSTLKTILESHPIKNLNGIIKSIKSDLAPNLALSKDKKRHSKAKLIEHILKLNKMGLLKKQPTAYIAPTQKNKTILADAIGKSLSKIKAKKAAAPKKEKEAIGDTKLSNGFKVKDYDKKKLFNFNRDIYIKYYGKDKSYGFWIKDEEREKAKGKKAAAPKKEKAPAKKAAAPKDSGFSLDTDKPKPVKKISDAVKKANESASKAELKQTVENEKRAALVKKLKAEAISRYGGKERYKSALADIKSSNNPTYIDNKIAELEAEKPSLTNKDLNKILKNIKAAKTEAELNVVLNTLNDFAETTDIQGEKVLGARDRRLKVLKPEPKSTKKPNPRGVTTKSILAKRQNEIVSKAVDELSNSFEASIEDETNKGIKGTGDYKFWAQLEPEGAMVIEEDKDLSKQRKVELQKKAMDLFIKRYKKLNKENKAKKPKKARTEKQKANDKKLGEAAKARAKKK
tara:strand:+ start:191 stop:1558 length:1368 start_codon:yes stop_codon:yes gene_type:complete